MLGNDISPPKRYISVQFNYISDPSKVSPLGFVIGWLGMSGHQQVQAHVGLDQFLVRYVLIRLTRHIWHAENSSDKDVSQCRPLDDCIFFKYGFFAARGARK